MYKGSLKQNDTIIVKLFQLQVLCFDPLNWSTFNFFLEYQYIIQQTGNENTQTYQVEVVILIWQKILAITLLGNVY